MKVYIGPYPKSEKDRKVSVRIDKYDTWSMDHTLAIIILPMLKQLKETTHGSSGSMPSFQQTSNSSQRCFDFYEEGDSLAWEAGHKEWRDILSEMIWAFEQIVNDNWEDQYWIVKPELDEEHMRKEYEEGEEYREIKWKVEGECDWEGRLRHQERINKGCELFGKYFQDLWD